MLNCIPDLNLNDASGQCFPLYWYEKIDDGKQNNNGGLFEKPDPDGYIRRDAIADWALSKFRKHYRDKTITKEDLWRCPHPDRP